LLFSPWLSQAVEENSPAGKGIRLNISQGSSPHPGASQHSLVGMLYANTGMTERAQQLADAAPEGVRAEYIITDIRQSVAIALSESGE